MTYDVIIMGSGLGGLECGYILSKQGYNVCILEKNAQHGGCLQTFKRAGTLFDTGFHFVGGLEEEQYLHKLFRYFDLLDLPWHKMDETGFAEVVLEGKSYLLPSGHEQFVDRLSEYFPHQRTQLQTYVNFLKQVGDSMSDSFTQTRSQAKASLFERSAYQFLQETIDDPSLRNVLSGASLTMELCPEKLPLYNFAQINNSFIQSSWRLDGGGSLIADKLAADIRQMGGTILTKAEVTRMVEKDGQIVSVEYNQENQVQAKYIISDLHPALTLSLIPESQHIRKIYRNRISKLDNTFGMFTLHLQLKEQTVPYLNRNIFIYKDDHVWRKGYQPNMPATSALVSYQLPKDDTAYTRNMDILIPMYWEEVVQWENTTVGKRGDTYEMFKQQKAEECLDLVSERMPELRNHIERYYTTTPLTYRDYTGTWKGSAYGIRKDYNNALLTILAPQTQIPNLLLTGQNLNLHGILGVSMTSILTCAKIVGMENLIKEL